jgi:predicted  nucleic acid-binding Zn-ribbon protein
MISQKEFDDAMDDLVKAEAEIERLQAEVVKWQAEAGRFGPGIEAAEALLEEAKAETERLRNECVRNEIELRALRGENKKLKEAIRAVSSGEITPLTDKDAEIEQLRQQREQDILAIKDKHAKNYANILGEIERLRTAIIKAMDLWDSNDGTGYDMYAVLKGAIDGQLTKEGK